MKTSVTTTTKGFVYFIVDYQAKKVKIGYSTNPQRRLKELLTSNEGKLELAKIVQGTVKDERKYQRMFCHSKIRREWFELTPEIEEFINRKVT
jgi:hypothetical protein